MAATTATLVANYLKDLHLNKQAVVTAMYKDKPLLNWITKEYSVPGQVWLQTVGYSLSAGASNTFTTAQSNAKLPNPARFTINPVDIYGVETLTRKLMMQAKSDGSLINLTTEKFKILLMTLSNKAHKQLYRSGTGVIGRRSSISTNTITLTNPADAANFYKNMVIVASAADGGALRTGSAIVTNVDRGRSTATVTVDSAAGISSFADNDYLYQQGDAANNSTNVALSGLEAWIPETVSATTFWGVDRTADVQNLAGYRINATTELLGARDSIEALITEMQTLTGVVPDAIFTTPRVAEAVRISASDAIRFVQVKGTAQLVIDAFEILGVPVIADYMCPTGKAFALKKDALSLKFVNPGFPDIVNEDGSDQSRVYNDDAYEMRSSNYCQLVVNSPIMTGVAYNIPSS